VRLASAPVSTHAYWIQVGAFRSVERAKLVMHRLRLLRAEMLLADRSWMRIRLGPFASRSAAVAVRRDLERNGLPAFITQDHN
jgi:cell division protein FtsN